MPKTLMSVRLDEAERAALERAAADDKRPVAAMARLMIHTGLTLRGYLVNGEAVRPPPKKSEPKGRAEEKAEPAPPPAKPKGRRK